LGTVRAEEVAISWVTVNFFFFSKSSLRELNWFLLPSMRISCLLCNQLDLITSSRLY
jgi:hypothetical protein